VLIATKGILPVALALIALVVAGNVNVTAQPTPPPADPAPPERLNPFPQRRLDGPTPLMPNAVGAVAQHARLGANFSNYYAGTGVRAYGAMRDGGASHDRVTFDWFRLQPAPGPFTVTVTDAYDTLLADAAGANISVLGILIGAPDWARDAAYPGGAYGLPRNLDLAWNDPNNYWGQFVFATVARYKDRVRAWEIWNEPNLDQFWPAPPAHYARLLQVAYQAAKAADPTTTVVLGGLFRGVNEARIRDIFAALRALDPVGANAFYHDVIGFHLYDGGHCSPFDEIAYLRDFYWRPYVGDKPMWVTESGIRVLDLPQPGFATPAESASFFITNAAYALAAGAQRYYFFRAIDPDARAPEQWGLLRADGMIRPSYGAMQVAAQHLPQQVFSAANDLLNGNAVRRATFYSAVGRVSAVWNISATSQTVVLPAGTPAATLVTQEGATSTLGAVNGQFVLTLAPVQNFRWAHPEGICQVAGPPLILVEAGVTFGNRQWLPWMTR
jgi:hypothetical protein